MVLHASVFVAFSKLELAIEYYGMPKLSDGKE